MDMNQKKRKYIWEKRKKKNYVQVELGKMKIKTWNVCFFKCSLNFRAHALQSELNKVSISNFSKFQLQSNSSNIEQAFEKNNIIFHQNRAKKEINQTTKRTINQCKSPKMRTNTIFCKNVLLCFINNLPAVSLLVLYRYQVIFLSFESDVQNTFPEPQPDSAS